MHADIPDGTTVVTTHGSSYLRNGGLTYDDLSSCSQEEADERLLLHTADCAAKGSEKLLVKTVDTDVVVLAITFFDILGVKELWVELGASKKKRCFPAHDMWMRLGGEKARALAAFHAFTGCDGVSSFVGRGKKTAWDAWTCFPDVTNAFIRMYLTL